MTRFTVSELESEQIAAAFPFARMAIPGIEPDSWARFADGLGANGGTILGVFASECTLHGMAIYRVGDSLQGRRLAVDAIVTFELNRTAPARAALVAALEHEAVRQGCASLTVNLPARGLDRSTAGRMLPWLNLGLNPDSILLGKPIACEPARNVAATD